AGLHAPDEIVLAALATYFNPLQADAEFIPYLAGWVDLSKLLEAPSTGEWLGQLPIDAGRLRLLIEGAPLLSQRRGTAEALLFYLQTATGLSGFTIDERVMGPDDRPLPFHIRVMAPKDAASYRDVIERIVHLEKPVYVTAEVLYHA
ncbi:MAG TPA: phage tail protein, partial [Anaerolineae bacterium]